MAKQQLVQWLLDEWDTEQNGSPNGQSNYSKTNVWWICKKDPTHKWQATIYSRAKGSPCPICKAQPKSIAQPVAFAGTSAAGRQFLMFREK